MNAAGMRLLRLRLAEAEITERAAEDTFAIQKAHAECQLLSEAEEASVKLTNEAAQKRYLAANLPKKEGYATSLATLRSAESAVIWLRAQLEAARDARREQELAVQRQLVDMAEPAQLTLRPAGRTPAFSEGGNHR